MSPIQYLKCIGKGQITIPQAWKKILRIEHDQTVKARIQGNTVIIEKHIPEAFDWDVQSIALNTLPIADKKLVKQGRKSYKQKSKQDFASFSEFFS